MSAELDIQEKHYWPFETVPLVERTDQHKCEILFLETAHREDFQPWMDWGGDFGATSGERAAMIVVRGHHRRWEVRVGTSSRLDFYAFISDFDCAAEVVLKWLRGTDVTGLVPLVQGKLAPGMPGFKVLDEKAEVAGSVPALATSSERESVG